MNYFDFFGIRMAFIIDRDILKERFYQKSRELHPDFHTLSDPEKQAEMLDASSMNNEAYKVLNDFDARMKYILEEMEVMPEEGEAKMPQEFLMEMMDVNEALMTLEMEPDPDKIRDTRNDLCRMKEQMLEAILPHLRAFEPDSSDNSELMEILDYYMKRRYLRRIMENLEKLESRDSQTS